ncbi:winged helix-turn-helix domain-containing protein [Streptomyces sp. NPDC050636]|uniref:ArsR/SmtB family transcription factor n=1 Tax=Streptomyces sp. NPDC050636 TaxID=3154510 RepID=UPI0034176F04
MLRVVFETDDVARVRVAAEPDFLWEIANSVQTLQRRDGAAVFGAWRRWARPRLSGSSRLLPALLPPTGYSPDFLTPTAGDRRTPEAAVDTLRSTPKRQLTADLARLAATRELPSWTSDLAHGELPALHRLGEAFQSYDAQAVAPFWRRIHAHIDADRALRMNTLLDGGAEGLLSGLGPRFRWRWPVLEADYPVDRTLELGGRGLTLLPSFFCWPTPVTLADPSRTPVLVYPVQHEPDWEGGRAGAASRGRGQPLGALLGQTRAALLRYACIGGSTGELARRLGVSTPAVSQHVAVLREAGLLITVRRDGRAFHTATAEGRALLRCGERGGVR